MGFITSGIANLLARDPRVEAIHEQLAYVRTLESQARVGSYQHEVSSAPWMILAAERAKLAKMQNDLDGIYAPRSYPPPPVTR